MYIEDPDYLEPTIYNWDGYLMRFVGVKLSVNWAKNDEKNTVWQINEAIAEVYDYIKKVVYFDQKEAVDCFEHLYENKKMFEELIVEKGINGLTPFYPLLTSLVLNSKANLRREILAWITKCVIEFNDLNFAKVIIDGFTTANEKKIIALFLRENQTWFMNDKDRIRVFDNLISHANISL